MAKTLRQLLKEIEEQVKDNPEILDYLVVRPLDEQTNSFIPTDEELLIGKFDNKHLTFAQAGGGHFEPNAVCIW